MQRKLSDHFHLDNYYIEKVNTDRQTLIFAPVMYTRFTLSEYQKVLEYGSETTFTHISLQHYGIPSDFKGIFYHVGLQILKHGINELEEHKPPIISEESFLLLKMTKSAHSFEIKRPEIHKNVLFNDNEVGIDEFLFEKYSSTMGFSAEEIMSMKYYVREYKIMKIFYND